MLQGNGKLIGIRSYQSKDGKQKLIYSVLTGDVDSTGIYKKCELITILEEDIKFANPKFMEEVTFTASISTFNGQSKAIYSDIQRKKS